MLARLLQATMVTLVVFLCLFVNSSVLKLGRPSSPMLNEIAAGLSTESQWAVFLFLLFNLLILLALRSRYNSCGGWFCSDDLLAGFVFLGSLAYLRDYSAAAESTEGLVWLCSVVLGHSMVVWSKFSKVGRSPESFVRWFVGTLVIFLVMASLWQAETGFHFEYRGKIRAVGPWENPNFFGLLMGTGIMLAVAMVRLRFLSAIVSKRATGSQHLGPRIGKHLEWGFFFFWILMAALLAQGLACSYSRGAWLGVVIGIAYFVGSQSWFDCCPEKRWSASHIVGRQTSHKMFDWLRRNHVPVALIFLSISALVFYYFRHTDHHHTRRILSVANPFDLSWRNRTAAWEGALQITAEHPGLGVGWSRPGSLSTQFYLPQNFDESPVIRTNDFLTLSSSLGIPVVVCFTTYVWLSLVQNKAPRNELLKAACRAGAIVLLVGFWFDGGLFKLPTAATFWILLELGRNEEGNFNRERREIR